MVTCYFYFTWTKHTDLLLWISISKRCLEVKWYSTPSFSWLLLARLVSKRKQRRTSDYVTPRLPNSLLGLKASGPSPLINTEALHIGPSQ